ncbi:hypothetical protein BASA82_000965 [Batrachochytrium salamandrivorans]|uniref:Uncharacterized protein n=1 Tax=Batrachochytrium salamandrivorans TaxID=1357716 RepID=A0ABQ8EYA9_9FUNG|nr:hypothetical protein BASA61_007264 [Batrachochytrium salamandrivorans]KAH6588780.1 hypothetical protein BASA50_010486 [Batrachochytrium salamandrivorans]KAH9261991.1 hypothetical protein BASA82_000965 [Batrachochytrium salamandrivorans]
MAAGSLLWLLVMAVSMLSGSFLAGNLPLAMSLSEERLRLISTFGSGLLVGTALVVIIPEGTETLYAAVRGIDAQHGHPSPSTGGVLDERIGKSVHATDHPVRTSVTHLHRRFQDGNAMGLTSIYQQTNKRDFQMEDSSVSSGRIYPRLLVSNDYNHQIANNVPIVHIEEVEDTHDHSEADHSTIQPHKYIGPSLLLGFAFMFLVDQISTHSHPSRIAVSELRDQHPFPKKKISATIGLVVHAAADGIALGAATTSGANSLELIVFAAIMLHKAPSAFGLCTYLLQEGHSRRAIRSHLLVFSAAAPIAAILTFLALLQADVRDPISTQLWTGVLLLFSAGTFLYVATIHVLPEIYQNQGSSHDHAHHHHSEKSLSKLQIVVLLIGFVTPMLLSIEHHH